MELKLSFSYWEVFSGKGEGEVYFFVTQEIADIKFTSGLKNIFSVCVCRKWCSILSTS